MKKLNKVQAISILFITIAILFLLACLFSYSFYSWNIISKYFFYVPTALLCVWTINYYFVSPKYKSQKNDKTTIDDKVINSIKNFSNKKNESIKEVSIGKQIWSAKNLNVTHFRNGDIIPEVKSAEEWIQKEELCEPAFCYYENDPANDEKYGKLYNYFAVEDKRILAPIGWKIPSYNDWIELNDFIKQKTIGIGVGQALKSCRQVNTYVGEEYNTTIHPRWEENENNIGADLYSFEALPGGFRGADGDSFDDIGLKGVWWTTTDDIYDDYDFCKTVAILGHFTSDLHFDSYSKCCGISVRCIKNEMLEV